MLLLLFFNIVLSQPDSAHIYQKPEVVVTATRTPINSIDAPSRVTRIDVSQMRNDGFEDTKTMLSLVNGIFVKDNGPAQLSTISLRGTAAEQTLFILDGVSLNNIQNGLVDLFLVPTSDLGTIEVSQGGASALYGANAVGGVINLETKSEAKDIVRLDLGAASFGGQKFGAEISEGIGTARIDFTAGRSRAANNYDFTFSNGATSVPMQRTGADYLIDNQSLKITLPSSGSTTSLFLQNIYADRGTPGAVTDPAFVGIARETDKNTVGILKTTGTFGSFGCTATAGLIYTYLHYVDPDTAYPINDYYKMLSFQPAVQTSYGTADLRIVGGIDAEFDRGESTEMQGTKKRNRAGAFASGMYTFARGSDLETRIFGALRYDDYSDFGSAFNPKLGLNVKPLAAIPVHLRASVGTSYRVPTFNDLYYAGIGNTNLKPEKSTDYDFGAVTDFSLTGIPVSLDLAADYYHILAHDGIVWVPQTEIVWIPENMEILSRGIELSFHLTYRSLLSIKGNYFFGRSLDVSDQTNPSTYNKQLIYIPENQSSFMAEVTPGIFRITAAVRYVGERFYTADNTSSLSPYAVTDISASARIDAGSFEIFPTIAIDDLFDREYEVLPQYPVPMRNYHAGLSFQFNQESNQK